MRPSGKIIFATGLALLFARAGCEQPRPAGNPHYVLGSAWQAEGVWHYPFQSFDLRETGLAQVYAADPAVLTEDGEVYDPGLLTAAHQTLQLPAIIRLTNLENGLQTLVRVNDRGPRNPGRILAVTPRVAALLGFAPEGVAQVRLEVQQAESREAAEAVQGGTASRLNVATAPRPAVRQESLPPPPGVRQGGRGTITPSANVAAEDAVVAAPTPLSVQRLPETVTRVGVAPGALWLRLGSFSRAEFARMQLARVGGLGARMETIRNGRNVDYRVSIGPFNRIPDADAALARVIAAGITDGRIAVE